MIAILLATLIAAQRGAVEVEPITCWWRTTATAVRVGEPFTVILTCSLLQAEAARVIADESRLDPSVVQLPPFEVVGGARARDVATAGRRFVQFQYRLRTIAENAFASEATVPALELTYRVESQAAGGDAVAGRDRTYALPPLTMRVLSLVPDTADDIREAPIATFEDIEAAASRAAMYRVAGGVALVLGFAALAVAVLEALRRRRASRPAAAAALSSAAVLKGAHRELVDVQEQVQRAGWTPDLIGRTLAAVRVVAAVSEGRPLAQRDTHAAGGAAAGEIVLSRNGRTAAVSAGVATAADDELRDIVSRLGTARYGRPRTPPDAPPPHDQLDAALAAAVGRAERALAGRPWRERLWVR